MIPAELMERIHAELDEGRAAPSGSLRAAMEGVPEAQAAWDALAELDAEMVGALDAGLPELSNGFADRVMGAVAVAPATGARAVTVVDVPRRAPVAWSAVAAAIAVLLVSGALLWNPVTKQPAPVAPVARTAAPIEVADAPPTFEFPRFPPLEVNAPLPRARQSLMGAGREVAGTARAVFHETTGAVSVVGRAPSNFLRLPNLGLGTTDS